MSTPNKNKPQHPLPNKDGGVVNDALRNIRAGQEDLNPDLDPDAEGLGHAPEGAGADEPDTTVHTGQTTRGSYATDSSTGAGRYMDHTQGTFGMDPIDADTDEPIDPKI